jgi:predicted nucleotidyltransferase component of viral defense system
LAEPYRFEIVRDDYGKETYQIRIYYHGPLLWGGSPRAIRLDVTRDEQMLLPTVQRSMIHPYSDEGQFSGKMISCYSLMEMLSEKLRAVCGQRRFAISRDLYDIYRLTHLEFSLEELVAIIPGKFHTKDVDIAYLDTKYLESRRKEYESDWKNRLDYLIPDSEVITFEEAWQSVIELIRQVRKSINE